MKLTSEYQKSRGCQRHPRFAFNQGSGRLLGLDVGADDLLNGAVLQQLFQSAVDLVVQSLVVVAHLKAVLFLSVDGGENLQALVLGDEGLGGAVVDDDGVALAGDQSLNGVSALVEAGHVVLAEVVGGVDVAGGILLHADLDLGAVEVVNRGDGGILFHDDGLDAGGVAGGEVDALGALLGDGDGAEADIDLAAGNGGDDRTELHVAQLHLIAQLVAIEILALADSEFDRIPFGDNDSLREAMLVAKKLKPRSEELRRQILHVESLMRVASEDDVKLFENMLKAIKGAKVSENAQFHRLETLRDELIATGMEKINSLMSENPSIDRQKLRALVSKAQKEAEKENSDRRYYRELFQFLKTNINQEQSDE